MDKSQELEKVLNDIIGIDEEELALASTLIPKLPMGANWGYYQSESLLELNEIIGDINIIANGDVAIYSLPISHFSVILDEMKNLTDGYFPSEVLNHFSNSTVSNILELEKLLSDGYEGKLGVDALETGFLYDITENPVPKFALRFEDVVKSLSKYKYELMIGGKFVDTSRLVESGLTEDKINKIYEYVELGTDLTSVIIEVKKGN